MKFPVLLAVLGFSALSFVVTLHVKNDVRDLENKRDQLQEEQVRMEEDIKVLETEYAFLSRPERLDRLAGRLGLSPVMPAQVLTVSLSAEKY